MAVVWSSNAVAVAETVARLPAAYYVALAAVGEAILGEARAAAGRLYDSPDPRYLAAHPSRSPGPHLSKYFEYLAFPAGAWPGGGGGAAAIQVHSAHPFVMGYEFGTRARQIVPRAGSGKDILKFVGWRDGTTLWRPSVEYPGMRAHNKRDELAAAVETAAGINWVAAFDEVTALFNAGSTF